MSKRAADRQITQDTLDQDEEPEDVSSAFCYHVYVSMFCVSLCRLDCLRRHPSQSWREECRLSVEISF